MSTELELTKNALEREISRGIAVDAELTRQRQRAERVEAERDGERRRAGVAETAWGRADRYARRYRLAWQSARARARAYGETMTRLSAALGVTEAQRDKLAALVRDLTDPEPCWLDHHGGCQAHGYLSLEDGERCPHAEAKELLASMGIELESE